MKNIGIMPSLQIIVAVDEHGGFSQNNTIPWINEPFASEDLKHFKQVTHGGACIMGRKTYHDMFDMVVARKRKRKKNSTLVKLKEILPGRESFVITKTLTEVEGATVAHSLRNVAETISKNAIFVIGGERLFIEALPWVNRIYMTVVPGIHQCDRFFPVNYVMKYFKIINGKQTGDLKFLNYQRK